MNAAGNEIARTAKGVVLRNAGAFGVVLVLLVGVAVWALDSARTGATISRLELTIAAVLLAGVVASVGGFAFSAIAGALLAHLYPDPVEMVRILLVCSITIQAYCTVMLLKSVRACELAPYLAGGLLAAPLGVFLLTRVSSYAYALGLGAFLVLYGVYSLRKPVVIAREQSRARDALVGALGGITGGVAAFPGAFITMWCSARGLSKESQRAICQPYILFMQVGTLAMLQHVRPVEVSHLSGLWLFVPVSLLAASLGFGIFKRLSNAQFRVVLLGMLVASGAVLMVKSS